MFTCFLTVTNLVLNPISYVIFGDHFQLFQRPNITENQVLETNLPGFPVWDFAHVVYSSSSLEKVSNWSLRLICLSSPHPVWKIWEEFETFLENKQISKMRKKHLGDQIVINSYVYTSLENMCIDFIESMRPGG